MPDIDAQRIGQARLDPHRVLDGGEREARAPGHALGVRTGGSGAAVAATEHVHADHEEPVGVHRFARAHEALPPAGLVRITARDVGVAGQRMLDQHGVGPPLVQCPPRFVPDDDLGQEAAGFKGVRSGAQGAQDSVAGMISDERGPLRFPG